VKQLLVIALLALAPSGCKQGLGERCQLNADCDSNICSKSSPPVCVSVDDKSQAQFDAEVPPAPIDAAIDAAIDAPIDAAVDGP
jgi:hypothetical protein